MRLPSSLFLICALSSVAGAQPVERTEAIMMSGMQTTPLPIVDEKLVVTIEGQHASTTLSQTYQNSTSTQLEGRYRLRPGSGSHVDGFAYWNGEAKIVGEVFEKQVAREVYDHVVSRGRDPGLLEEEGEGQFAFKVFPIEPQEKKKVELRWSKLIARHVKTVTYRAPLASTHPEVTIDIIGPAKNVHATSGYALRIDQTADGITHLRSTGATTTAGELVVEWEVDDNDWTPTTWVHPGDGKTEGWFAIALAAPKLPPTAAVPKDVTIVIDHSGSMQGDPMEHAKAAAVGMIRLLDRNDRVNVIGFDDDVDPLYLLPKPLEGHTRDEAIAFVNNIHEGGGTDIALALRRAIASQEGKTRPHIVVFMTDGQSDVKQAIEAANADNGDVRLFTVGLGSAVNKPFLSRLAAIKRGRFTYIEQANMIEPDVARLATQIAHPVLVDVSVELEGAVASRVYPRTLPDLFAEDQLVVSGRMRGNGPTKFIVKGKLEGKPVVFTRTVDLGKPAQRPWVGKVWAQSRVDHLLEQIQLDGETPEMKTEVIDLALAYNFVTPYTSFLAIPESELGDMKSTVDNARAAKQQAIAKHQEVARLDADKNGKVAQKTADVGGGGGGDADADDESDPAPRSYRTAGNAPMAPDYAEATSVHRHGCAGCSTTADGASASIGGLLIGGLVLRRRRRR